MNVKFENRAWKGIRVHTETITEGSIKYEYCISWHFPIGRFYLEECVTKRVPYTYYIHNQEFQGTRTDCSGKIIAFSDSFDKLINHIQELRKIVLVPDKETAKTLTQQIEYAITNGQESIKKYPSSKGQTGEILVI